MNVLFILSIVFLAAGVVMTVVSLRRQAATMETNRRLIRHSESLVKREDAVRDAMRRNGAARLELDRRESDFSLQHKNVDAIYSETDDDRTRYPSESKRLAVVKSRLAHILGYKILAEFPDPSVEVSEDGGVIYSYRFQVKEEK